MKSINLKSFGYWLLPLGAVAAVITAAILTTPAPKPPALVRYIGPPLKDGTRVTFLHPASVSKFLGSPNSKPTQTWIIQSMGMANLRVISKEEALWYRLPFAGRVPARDLGVSVMVTSISKTYLTKRLIVSGRSERQYIYVPCTYPANCVCVGPNYGDDHVDEVDIVDAPRGRQYAFQYHSLNNSQSPEFAAHKAAIVNSFQVLPPGVKPPVP